VTAASDLFFGLATAFGWGVGDFLARQASHRVGHRHVLTLMALLGSATLLPFAAWLEGPTWRPTVAWAILAGLAVVSLAASLFLYRSFEYGVLSVVSPLASSYPAVTAGLAILFLGERPGGPAVAGIALVLTGIALLSRGPSNPSGPPPKDARAGLASAVGAFLGFGVFYFGLAFVVDAVGPITSAALTRTIAAAILLLPVAAGHGPRLRPPRELWRFLVTMDVLYSGAFLAYNVGILTGSVAIVSTLSGLFSAVTVGLATLVLRERLGPTQYAAIGAVFLGVVLMALR
jgi:drug/metabolite transporter (DMT)-like permease